MMKNTSKFTSQVLLALLIVPMAAAQTIAYKATMLGSVCDTCSTHALAVNEHGTVVGDIYNQTPGSSHIFLWSPKSGMTDLGTLPNGGDSRLAYGINGRNEITGCLSLAIGGPYTNAFHAYRYWKGEFLDLGVIAGNQSCGTAINRFGDIVGYTTYDLNNLNSFHAFRYTKGQMHEIADLNQALAINNRGDIAGWTFNDSALPQPTAIVDGQLVIIDTLGGSRGMARGINNNQSIVGSSLVSDDPIVSHAFLWQNGILTDLGTLGGGTLSGRADVSDALAINDSGDIVGVSQDLSHAFLYQGGRMYDLNELVQLPTNCDYIWSATAINNRGDIVGYCVSGDGRAEAILLSPLQGH
jgi:probable HAF family extracellular repeat protein